MEDSSFSDPDLLEELLAVENDLIDGYARNELPPAERERFERLFLADPDRRQRVEFAAALASMPTVRSIAGTRRPGQSLASFFRMPRLALTFAVAAVFIVMIAGAWKLLTRTNPRSTEVASGPESGGGKSQPESSPLTNENTQKVEPAPKVEKPLKPSVATFVLSPGLSRSSSERTRLIVPRGSQVMQLKLQLEEHDAAHYEIFTADLRRAGARIPLLGSQAIHPSKRDRSLVLTFPVHALDSSDYELTLKGRATRQKSFEPVSYYYLTIVKE